MVGSNAHVSTTPSNDARRLSPLDGRYREQVAGLAGYFSEHALFEYRQRVELEWLVYLTTQPAVRAARALAEGEERLLREWMQGLSDAQLERIKAIERTTRHDVKALEYYLKERLAGTSMADLAELVHFCCTSEDVNNLAYGLMLRDGLGHEWRPLAERVVNGVRALAEQTAEDAMLSRTHGQPASPTTVGKELAVFVYRWQRQLDQLAGARFLGKFGGTVGNFNAHVVAYPDAPWEEIARGFVERLGLTYNPLTTQIEPHDYMAELFHGLCRFNTIGVDFCRDMWAYVGLGYFRQRVVGSEVGSSTMPHKVNPIDFENAEANFGLGTELLGHLALKLPVSRLQRDLSDSTALRNVGVGIGYSVLALRSLERAAGIVEVDRGALRHDLEHAWQVLAEPVQTVMRRAGCEAPYERLKELTRGTTVDADDMRRFIEASPLGPDDRRALLDLKPWTYVGLAPRLLRWIRKRR